LRSNQNLRAAVRATYPSLAATLSRHRAITRLALAGLALAVALGVSLQDAAAGIPRPNQSTSILPENDGVGVLTTAPITISFSQPMDAASVESSLSLEPAVAIYVQWNADHTELTVVPQARWQTDQRYVVSIPGSATSARGLQLSEARQVSFTTQTAPTVGSFRVHLVEPESAIASDAIGEFSRNIPFGDESAAMLGSAPLIDAPADTADDASSNTGIHVGFTTAMDKADVEARFNIDPHVRGSFSWEGNQLAFEPKERLKPGTRYAVSVVGAHDQQGNRLAGDVSFSFTTRGDAELVSFTPDRHETGVMARQVVIHFSQPMNAPETRQAIRVRDVDTGRRLRGGVDWNDRHTRLEYRFKDALPRGHTIEVRLSRGARDRDGNQVSITWRFETRARSRATAEPAPIRAPAPVRSGPNAPSGTLDYALWQINQSRADYGFGPLRLDAAISDVAAAHAWDQVRYGYFSHTGRDGSHVSDRLRAAGISFGWSGENQCYYNGLGLRAMLDWCHSTFMSEPYPGFANHIGNILSSHYSRVGIGVAQSGGKVIIVWDFAG
jgi:uncharacterized protein YkwD